MKLFHLVCVLLAVAISTEGVQMGSKLRAKLGSNMKTSLNTKLGGEILNTRRNATAPQQLRKATLLEVADGSGDDDGSEHMRRDGHMEPSPDASHSGSGAGSYDGSGSAGSEDVLLRQPNALRAIQNVHETSDSLVELLSGGDFKAEHLPHTQRGWTVLQQEWAVFLDADMNENKKLEHHEFSPVCTTAHGGLEVASKICDDKFAKLDTNSDKEASFLEFITFVNHQAALAEEFHGSQSDLQVFLSRAEFARDPSLFDTIDTNGDGMLQWEEFRDLDVNAEHKEEGDSLSRKAKLNVAHELMKSASQSQSGSEVKYVKFKDYCGDLKSQSTHSYQCSGIGNIQTLIDMAEQALGVDPETFAEEKYPGYTIGVGTSYSVDVLLLSVSYESGKKWGNGNTACFKETGASVTIATGGGVSVSSTVSFHIDGGAGSAADNWDNGWGSGSTVSLSGSVPFELEVDVDIETSKDIGGNAVGWTFAVGYSAGFDIIEGGGDVSVSLGTAMTYMNSMDFRCNDGTTSCTPDDFSSYSGTLPCSGQWRTCNANNFRTAYNEICAGGTGDSSASANGQTWPPPILLDTSDNAVTASSYYPSHKSQQSPEFSPFLEKAKSSAVEANSFLKGRSELKVQGIGLYSECTRSKWSFRKGTYSGCDNEELEEVMYWECCGDSDGCSYEEVREFC